MPDRPLTPQEEREWAQVARSIRTLRAPATTPPDGGTRPQKATKTAKPVSRMRSTAPAELSNTATQSPRDQARERRVRRGKLEISATLDLHGYTQETATAVLQRFLSDHQRDTSQCVLVITGKGARGEGVLRRNLLAWLESPAAGEQVSGYAAAHQKHGGSGAFYLFLRRAHRR